MGRMPSVVEQLVFIRQHGFPRRWSAIRGAGGAAVGFIDQAHEQNRQGRSVFRYRAAVLPYRPLGLFTTLRDAKQAIKEALGSP